MLETFIQRLRNICPDNGTSDGEARSERIRSQAQHAVALASEFGILKSPGFSWEELSADSAGGAEHMVEFNERVKRVGKTTKPPGFGLVPALLRLPIATRPGVAAEYRAVIEFVAATPLEYLVRWKLNNEIFGDDAQLASVIAWMDGNVSFGITQPQYQGIPADRRDIEIYFQNAGWKSFNDPSGHRIFYNYAFQVMAIDAESRNCYITEHGLQPFDVILFEPKDDIERFLGIYPH